MFVAANAHFLYVAVMSQPDCVAHSKVAAFRRHRSSIEPPLRLVERLWTKRKYGADRKDR